jgi:hypothetical protein
MSTLQIRSAYESAHKMTVSDKAAEPLRTLDLGGKVKTGVTFRGSDVLYEFMSSLQSVLVCPFRNPVVEM